MKKGEKSLTKRELSTIERRKHIVEAAAVCFVEQGFHQSSMRDVAKQAQVSLGNLYNHFDSKTDLIAEIAGLEADDLAGIFDLSQKAVSGFESLGAFVAVYFDYISKPENAVLAAEITAEAMRSPELVEKFTANRNRNLDAIEVLLTSDDMVFPETGQVMAEILLDLIESTATRVAFESEQTKASARSGLRSILGRLLNIRKG
ncbi:TetR/AcrR family transcriptional regulator [Phaeobacter sp. C3_T13_0]|uniref:TetR/AcrR family transcriptional regulator n=1 Tax=Phaeobacter cretensis TaxID=3342641 RepID=UPI0039BC9284